MAAPAEGARKMNKASFLRIPWRVQRMMSRDYFLERLTRRAFREIFSTRPVAADRTAELEVCSLLDKRNVANYLVTIKSLFLQLPRPTAVTVLSDGSLDSDDVAVLEHHVQNIRVLRWNDVRVPDYCAADTVERWCTEYRYLAKLMYLPFAAQRPLTMILDSDVVFRRPLGEVFHRLPKGAVVTYNCDHDHSQHDPYFHYLQQYAAGKGVSPIRNLNCGLMVWRREHIHPEEALEFLEYLVRRQGHLHAVAEQDAWSLLASSLPHAPLPPEYLVLSNWELNTAENRQRATSIHYVRGQRYVTSDYLRDGKNVIAAFKRR
jgi:hypothetical protein